jgi:hypothetical protein
MRNYDGHSGSITRTPPRKQGVTRRDVLRMATIAPAGKAALRILEAAIGGTLGTFLGTNLIELVEKNDRLEGELVQFLRLTAEERYGEASGYSASILSAVEKDADEYARWPWVTAMVAHSKEQSSIRGLSPRAQSRHIPGYRGKYLHWRH